ncbi:hypothetical protein IAT38_000850 [Cryptococcus sp. DSM 104549]
MSGGFIEPKIPAESAERPAQPATARTGVLTRLTARQEGRLRAHLDERLAALERDERTHNFTSLPALLTRLSPLLQLILQIPPFPPSSYLRTSYLLTLTGVIPNYLSSLPLLPPGVARRAETDEQAQEEAGRVLRLVLAFLREVDRGWEAVLGGKGWVPPEKAVKRENGEDGEADGEAAGEDEGVLVGGKPVKVDFGGQVDQTERIRLRSIILSGREKMLAWAGTYGSFPGSSLPSSTPASEAPIAGSGTSDGGASSTEGWETEILNMWDGALELLSEADLSGA